MDFRAVVKYIVGCVNMLVGLFLSIPQVTTKDRKPNLMGTMREIWDLCNKIYLDVRTERCQVFFVQTFNIDNRV
jgi:hypothetical protein